MFFGVALSLAGTAHLRHPPHGGARIGVLADFFMGAQAAVEGSSLLPRGPRRYRTYFPSVVLITPEA